MKLSVLSFLLSFAVAFFVARAIGQSFQISLFTGATLAGISSAVVLPIIRNVEMSERTRLAMVVDSALSDVLAILLTVTLIEIFTLEQVLVGRIFGNFLSSFLIAILMGVAAGLVWSRFITNFLKEHGKFYILTLAFMLVLYSGTQLVGSNGAIACLVFGLMLGNSKRIAVLLQQEKGTIITRSGKDFYAEIAFLVQTFFFVYLGLLINFSEPISFLWAFIILGGMYLVRPWAVFLSYPKTTNVKDVKISEVLIPKGLAAAVLVQLPIQAGIEGASSMVNIVLAVILLSIIASTVMIYLVKKDKYSSVFPLIYDKFRTEEKGSA